MPNAIFLGLHRHRLALAALALATVFAVVAALAVFDGGLRAPPSGGPRPAATVLVEIGVPASGAAAENGGTLFVIRLDAVPNRRFWEDAGAAGPAVVRIGPGDLMLDRPILLPSGARLEGAGQGVTRIVAAAGMAAMVENLDSEAGNADIAVVALSVDCAQRARHGLRFIRAERLTLRDVSVTGCREAGARISGHGRITRGAVIDGLDAHDNPGDGLIVQWAMRSVRYNGVLAQRNGRRGVVIDHSEALAVNVAADANQGDGIHVRNLFGANLSNLTATRNGGHGIYVEGFVRSTGSGWAAMGNGVSQPGWYDEIHFTGDTGLSYGVSRDSALTGIVAGAYEAGTGPATARHGLWLDPSVVSVFVAGLRGGDVLETVCAGPAC